LVSDKSEDVALRGARLLEKQLLTDKRCTIEKKLVFDVPMQEYQKKQGLTQRPKFDDVVVEDSQG